MTKPQTVFIIILNWNGGKFILDCLESAMKLETRNWKLEIVLVDNASTDNSLDLIQKSKIKNQSDNFKLTIIENNENLGFAEGNNVGIRYALENGADYVMLLNPDTLVEKNLLVHLIDVAETDDKIGILSPKIYFAPGFEYHHDRYKDSQRGKVIWFAGGEMDWKNVLASHRGVDEVDKGQFNKSREIDFATGCCFFVKKQVFQKIGLLDNDYFLYWEDNDFCQRAKGAGFKIYFVSEASIFHLNAGSSKSGSDLQDYFISRNRMIYGMRYAALRAKAALIKESIKLLISGRKFQKKGIMDFYIRKLGKGSYFSE